MLSHSTLELVQGMLVHVHTTFLSFLIYYMTHHQQSYVAKSTNNYLTAIGDALTQVQDMGRLAQANHTARWLAKPILLSGCAGQARLV